MVVDCHVYLYTCSSTANIGDEEVRTLTSIGHLYQFEILKHGKSWVDLLTAQNSMDALHSLGLTECNPLTSLKDLLDNELQQNWGTLQHHSLHPSWQNEPSRAVSLATQESLGGNSDVIEDSTEDWKTANLQRHSVLKRDTGNEDETSEKCKGADNCGKQGEDGGSGMDRSDNDWFAQYVSFWICSENKTCIANICLPPLLCGNKYFALLSRILNIALYSAV